MTDKPRAEVDIDELLVRSLLGEQCPELAALPLTRVAEGWDNEIWRLGDGYAVRMPRRGAAVALVEHEQQWLGRLAPSLPVPVPVAVVAGRPTERYPWPWSLVEWHPGEALGHRPGSASIADAMGGFLEALHVPAPADAPPNAVRGVALADRREMTERWFATAETLLDPAEHARLHAAWHAALAQPTWSRAPVWVHGDLHPLNLVVDGDELAAVIDFGDLTSGDPASDLAVAWMAFDPPERARLQRMLPAVDPATWRRAHGWAVALGVAILANADDTPDLARMARAILARVLDGAPIVAD